MVKKKSTESKGIDYSMISYIISIIAIVNSFISPSAGLVLGIISLVFSTKEKSVLSKRAKVISIVSIVVSVIILAVIIYMALTGFQGLTQGY